MSTNTVVDRSVSIKLQRGTEGWIVLGNGVLVTSQDLESAAVSALLLAELHGTAVELGAGVPGSALERGRQLRAQLELLYRA